MVFAWLNALGYLVKMEIGLPGITGNFGDSAAFLGYSIGLD